MRYGKLTAEIPPPCVGCGYCCNCCACVTSIDHYGLSNVRDGCPALVHNGKRYVCKLYVEASPERREYLDRVLAIGMGCGLPDNPDRAARKGGQHGRHTD